MVQARRSQEDPKTWTKLQDTVFQRPGIDHLEADIQGTGIDLASVISEPTFKGAGIDPALVISEPAFREPALIRHWSSRS